MFRLITPPLLLRKIYHRLTWKIKETDNIMYLTFDDGPTPGVTEWVLSLLEKYNAKASFFCIGTNVERYPELFQRVIDEGHRIGNHTQHHVNGWKMSISEYIEDVMAFDKIYQSELFRPPYGKITKQQIKMLSSQFKIIMWSVISYDFDTSFSKEKCLRNVIKNAGKGSIVVFHDSKKAFGSLEYCLPRVLEHYHSKGFVFRAIPLKAGAGSRD